MYKRQGQYYNLEDFTARFRTFLTKFNTITSPTNTEESKWKIDNYFTEFTPGLRLIYLPAIDTEENIEAGDNTSEFAEIVNKLLKNDGGSSLDDTRQTRLRQLAKIHKLYYIEEKINRGWIGAAGKQLTGSIQQDALTVELYPFPLLDTTSDNYASVGLSLIHI